MLNVYLWLNQILWLRVSKAFFYSLAILLHDPIYLEI